MTEPMSGQLFTHYFLTDGIRATPEWQASATDPETFAPFRESVLQRYEALARSADPNEAVTEQDLIRPVLELLGWADYLPQQGTARNEDIPDHLLFADAGPKERASAEPIAAARARHAAVVEESKRFGLPLDERDREAGYHARSPHSQILRYLATAEIESESRVRWGLLTNGRLWRLYDYRARPRASGYFEADLEDLLAAGREEDLRVFQLLFRRESFTPQEGAAESFLEAALAEGRRYEEQVAQDLSGVVFESVFPALVQALAEAAEKRGGEADLPVVHKAALIFLYRLLFVLYAEDRGLLPVNDSRYDDYGLRKRVRDDVARRMEESDTFSAVASNYYDRLLNLFRIIDQGDPSIGLPPYNGGLFAREAAPLLETVRLPDDAVAPVIHDLSHARDAYGERRFVNYRDMSVQQLGSLYERLLEREPVRGGDGIEIRPNPYARKDSGSFYTPQELVDLIVERTLKPLAEERLKAFEEKAEKLKSDRRPRAQRQAELLKLDPAEAVLDLKVLDPAMGSGHFLVTAVDFLSDNIAELIASVPAVPEWLDGEYASPLVGRVAAIRDEILKRAAESDWVLDEAQLTDQAIIRCMVLRSLLRRDGAGADQAPCRRLVGAAEAPGAPSGYLPSARRDQLLLRRLQRPRGRVVDASQAQEARLGGAHLPQSHPAPVRPSTPDLPRPRQSVDAHDRTDPAMVSAPSGHPRLHRDQRLLDESPRMPSDGRPLLRHQEQRPGGPPGRGPTHAGIPRLATSEQGRCEAGEGPELNAHSLTEH